MKKCCILLMAAVAGCFAGCNKETDNTVPIACFEFTPTSGTTTTVFQFDASGSSDAETPVEQLQVRWDWENNGTWTPFSTIKTVAHQFETAGFYSVSLEVMDAGELTDCITYTVMVTSGGKEKDGTFTDPRDGHTYGYKVIGSQIWMCENLAYLPEVSPLIQGPSPRSITTYTDMWAAASARLNHRPITRLTESCTIGLLP